MRRVDIKHGQRFRYLDGTYTYVAVTRHLDRCDDGGIETVHDPVLAAYVELVEKESK